jgi:hypothetical protein
MTTPPKLSVCLPTRSTMQTARQTIDNLREFCRRDGLEAVISDNSGDAPKRVILESMASDRFRYLESHAANAVENWTNALRHARGELACVLSDDDLLIALPGFDPEALEAPAGVAGLRPQMALYSESTGIYAYTGFAIAEERAVDRVRAYFERNGGANTTLFSCFRRSLLQDLLLGIDAHHPTRAGYTDWSMVLGLVSSGKVLAEPRLLYVYNNRNWLTAEDIARNTVRTFVDAGLPTDAAQILQPLTAVDAFATICRASSPVSADEKLEAACYAVEVYFDGFARQLCEPAFVNTIDPDRRQTATQLVLDARTPVDKLAASLLIVDEWLPGRHDAYQDYFAATIDPAVLRAL